MTVKSWKEELDEKYQEILEDATYTDADLDGANEAICEAILKLSGIKQARQKEGK